jgi:type III secretory pathway lipoprotein EscJ
MGKFIRSFLVLFFLVLLSACSSTPLQSSRLDKAETNITQAEQILTQSSDVNAMKTADEKLGVARSYLATVLDNKKYLNKTQLQKYEALKRRLDRAYERVNL